MAELRINLDAFEDIWEQVPGKSNAAKFRYLVQFYEEIVVGEELKVLHTVNGETGTSKTRYSQRLHDLAENQEKRFVRDLGISIEDYFEHVD